MLNSLRPGRQFPVAGASKLVGPARLWTRLLSTKVCIRFAWDHYCLQPPLGCSARRSLPCSAQGYWIGNFNFKPDADKAEFMEKYRAPMIESVAKFEGKLIAAVPAGTAAYQDGEASATASHCRCPLQTGRYCYALPASLLQRHDSERSPCVIAGISHEFCGRIPVTRQSNGVESKRGLSEHRPDTQ